MKTLNKRISYLLVLPVVLLLSSALAIPSQAQTPLRKLTLTTTGVSKVTPDAVRLNVSISHQGSSSAIASSSVAVNHKNLLAVLRKAGIKDSDFKTQNLTVNPEYNYNTSNGVSEIIGYRATQIISIKVISKIDAGSIVDSIVALSDDFSILSATPVLLNEDATYSLAIKKAVALNKSRALIYVKSLGAKLGRAQVVLEGTPVINYPPRYAEMAKDSTAPSAPTIIDLGEESVSVTVTITWEIK